MDIEKDVEKVSFSSASSSTDGKATPIPVVALKSYLNRILRLFPKTRSGAGMSNCFTGLNTDGSSQSLANKLATLEGVQEKESEAVYVTVGLKFYEHVEIPLQECPSREPLEDRYAIETTSNAYLLLEKEWVHGQARPLFDMVFGKDSLKDTNVHPAAILPDYDATVLAIFVWWTYDRGSRSMMILMQGRQFATRYFPCLQMSRTPTPNSKTRSFFIDLVAFIIQEIDTSRNWKKNKAILNCDLSFKKKETLVELIQSLEGSKIRSSRGKVPDPRDAPVCVYHYHGDKEKCPHKALSEPFCL